MTILIVEGADCVGKTTLVEALVKRTGLKSVAVGAPPEDEDHRFWYLNKLSEGQIFDRFHIGSLVYGFQGMDLSPSMPMSEWCQLDQCLKTLDARLIVLTASSELIAKRFKKKEQRDSVTDIIKANVLFASQSNYSSLPTLKFHVTDDFKISVNFTENVLKSLEDHGWLEKVN